MTSPINEFNVSVTVWKNDHNRETARFTLQTSHGVKWSKQDAMQPARLQKIEIKPGEELKLPSKFDDAIQRVDETGTVVGGLCPWLTKNGVRPRLHKSIDWLDQLSAAEAEELETYIKRARLQKAREEAAALQAEEAKLKEEAKTALKSKSAGR